MTTSHKEEGLKRAHDKAKKIQQIFKLPPGRVNIHAIVASYDLKVRNTSLHHLRLNIGPSAKEIGSFGPGVLERKTSIIHLNFEQHDERNQSLYLAHALGHHLLHEEEGDRWRTHWDAAERGSFMGDDEREAELFAITLMMPEGEFLNLRERGVQFLSNYFGVPVKAVEARLDFLMAKETWERIPHESVADFEAELESWQNREKALTVQMATMDRLTDRDYDKYADEMAKHGGRKPIPPKGKEWWLKFKGVI